MERKKIDTINFPDVPLSMRCLWDAVDSVSERMGWIWEKSCPSTQYCKIEALPNDANEALVVIQFDATRRIDLNNPNTEVKMFATGLYFARSKEARMFETAVKEEFRTLESEAKARRYTPKDNHEHRFVARMSITSEPEVEKFPNSLEEISDLTKVKTVELTIKVNAPKKDVDRWLDMRFPKSDRVLSKSKGTFELLNVLEIAAVKGIVRVVIPLEKETCEVHLYCGNRETMFIFDKWVVAFGEAFDSAKASLYREIEDDYKSAMLPKLVQACAKWRDKYLGETIHTIPEQQIDVGTSKEKKSAAATPSNPSPSTMTLAQFNELLRKQFNESELKDVCLTLQVDYELLPGNSKADKSRELILYLQRRGRVPHLLTLVKQERPHITWPDTISD